MKTHFIERKVIQDKKKPSKSSNRLQNHVEFGPMLLDLVRLRVAQIHQSQIGVEKHRLDLKAKGEKDERLEQLQTWHASTLFSKRERMALAWGETISLNPTGLILKSLLRAAKHYFNKEQILSLTLAILATTDWNYR